MVWFGLVWFGSSSSFVPKSMVCRKCRASSYRSVIPSWIPENLPTPKCAYSTSLVTHLPLRMILELYPRNMSKYTLINSTITRNVFIANNTLLSIQQSNQHRSRSQETSNKGIKILAKLLGFARHNEDALFCVHIYQCSPECCGFC